MDTMSSRSDLLAIIESGLNGVDGKRCVINALHGRAELQGMQNALGVQGNIGIVAIGKAASSMAEGALKYLGSKVVSGLVVSKDTISLTDSLPPYIEQLVAGHPVPDQRSLDAGQALIRYLKNCSPATSLLFLISGGASALVEVLPEKVSLQQLQKLNHWLLTSGLDIEQMNAIRQCVSCIKAGRLASYIQASQVVSLLMSDVMSNSVAMIGSGLLAVSRTPLPDVAIDFDRVPQWVRQLCLEQPLRLGIDDSVLVHIDQVIVIDLDMALNAMMQAALDGGYTVFRHDEEMSGNVMRWADTITEYLVEAPSGLHLWGGETTLQLPATSGCGGRNTHLALLLAQRLYDKSGFIVATVASDGDDGNSGYAGAIVDGSTLSKAGITQAMAQQALAYADSATLLKQAGALLSLAKGRSNVADIFLLVKH